jgi:hypothetical protein
MLGFIHITKTGGTDIKDKNENDNIEYGLNHFENALFYKQKQMKCFTILREPIDRYISLFYYNMFGSNKYYKYDNTYNNINDFIDEHYNNRTLIDKYEDGIQFKAQVEWLQEADDDNTFIILFDKNNLIKNIKEMCLFNNIDFMYNNNIEKINTTNYENIVELTENSKNKIKEMYIDDYILYNKLLKLNKQFCKLSELNNK